MLTKRVRCSLTICDLPYRSCACVASLWCIAALEWTFFSTAVTERPMFCYFSSLSKLTIVWRTVKGQQPQERWSWLVLGRDFKYDTKWEKNVKKLRVLISDVVPLQTSCRSRAGRADLQSKSTLQSRRQQHCSRKEPWHEHTDSEAQFIIPAEFKMSCRQAACRCSRTHLRQTNARLLPGKIRNLLSLTRFPFSKLAQLCVFFRVKNDSTWCLGGNLIWSYFSFLDCPQH